MSVLLTILKILGFILLGLLALVLLLLLIPVTADIQYADQALVIRLRYGPVNLKLIDTGEKKKKKAKKEPEPEPESEPPKQQRKGGIDLNLILKLIRPGFKALGSVVKSLKIRDLRVVLVASGAESDEIGIKAGRMWAALGSIMTALNLIWDDIDYNEITVIPDFAGQHEGQERIGCKITAFPIIIVYIGIVFLVRFLRIKREQDNKHRDKNKRAPRAIKETTI